VKGSGGPATRSEGGEKKGKNQQFKEQLKIQIKNGRLSSAKLGRFRKSENFTEKKAGACGFDPRTVSSKNKKAGIVMGI